MALSLQDISVNELGSSFRTKINSNNSAIVSTVNSKADGQALSDHIAVANIHRVCNDTASASSAILWSSQKINTLINNHTHNSAQITDGTTVFAPHSHQHSIADLTDTAGMLGDYTGKTISQTNNATDASQSHIDLTLSTNLSPIPRLTEYAITVTFKNTTTLIETTPRAYKSLNPNNDIIKPASSSTIWTNGTVQATIGVIITNIITGTSCSSSFVISNVAKYNYQSITLQALKNELKLDNDFVTEVVDAMQERVI